MKTEQERQTLPLSVRALRLRALVLALGECSRPPWWKTEFMNETGLRFLERLYPRTSFQAAIHAAGKRRQTLMIGLSGESASTTFSGCLNRWKPK